MPYSVILASPVGHRTDGFWTTGKALHAASSLGPAALWIAAPLHQLGSMRTLCTLTAWQTGACKTRNCSHKEGLAGAPRSWPVCI